VPLARRTAVVVFQVLMSRYTVVQAALMLLALFFALFFQDYARPYESLTADHVEFGSLLITHFILLIGILFHAVQLEQLARTEGQCLSVINSIDNAQNLSVVEEEFDDLAISCSQEKLSFDAADATYDVIAVSLKWLPVLYVMLALWAIYRELYGSLQRSLRAAEEEDEGDTKLDTKLVGLIETVLAPGVVSGAKEFLRKSTQTEREYFKHLLKLLDEHYQDWLDRQAKTFHEFIERTYESIISNLRTLFRIFGAFLQIIFCLRGKKRTHVDAVNIHEDTGINAAAALPPSNKKKIVAKIATKVSLLLSGGEKHEEEEKKPTRDANAPGRQQPDVDTSDDLVEAYIKFAKEAAEKENGLAKPSLEQWGNGAHVTKE